MSIHSSIYNLFYFRWFEYSFYFQNKGVFNWTATYRSDSTIVAPYERWTYYNENVKVQTQLKQYAANKTRQVINNRI